MAPELSAVTANSPAILRPIQETDVDSIARWYDKAVVLAGSPVPLSDVRDCSGRVLVITEGDQQPVGLMLVALDEPGWVTVVFLAIAETEQRDVAGQAVALLETSLNQEANHLRAAVPLDVGLALYFWLRLGYRPAVSGEELWMIRELDP